MVSNNGFVRRHSENYNFIGESGSGTTYRWGKTFNDNPPMSPWPELADISISNRCSKGCAFCYRNSTPDGGMLTLGEYKLILDELTSPTWGPPFQIALGGGEPTDHPQLIEILEETKSRGIIPNLTTNGDNLSLIQIEAFKRFCGAIALSVSTINSVKISSLLSALSQAGVRTNIHFLLSKSSIEIATGIINGKYDYVFRQANAVIFLTHKPMGRANPTDCILFNQELQNFLTIVNKPKSKIRFGFDACFVPLLLKYTNIDQRFVDSCECGLFSVYIDEKMNVKPCSFSIGDEFTFNLRDHHFKDIWEKLFDNYRDKKTCDKVDCKAKNVCNGVCLFHESVNLCKC